MSHNIWQQHAKCFCVHFNAIYLVYPCFPFTFLKLWIVYCYTEMSTNIYICLKYSGIRVVMARNPTKSTGFIQFTFLSLLSCLPDWFTVGLF